jgi:hypothetical protein
MDRCEATRKLSTQSTLDEVWDCIEPAVPDCVRDIGHGVFEAKWAAPVPMMDIEILRRTEGILIHGDIFEPEDMACGIAVRFSLY